MSYESERDAIRQRIVSQWGATTEISWDGFNGAPYTRKEGVSYIRPRVEDGDSEWVTISASLRRERKYGTLVIDVNTPVGTGGERGNQLCDLLVSAFSAFTDGSVRFDRRGWCQEVGSDDVFYTWRVFLPYYREETVSI